MKHILSLGLIFTLISCCTSQNTKSSSVAPGTNSSSATSEYPIAVSFNSICCGTPSPDFLKSFVLNFNKKNRTNISADIAAGCGREGEFSILFKLPENASVSKKFKTELQVLVERTDAANKKGSTSSGGISLQESTNTADYQYCRLGIKPWDLK